MIEIKNILNDISKENELLRKELIKAFPNEFELKEKEYFYKNKKGEWCIWKNPDTNAKVVAIWKPEKTADELFEELGYEITEIKKDGTKEDGIQFMQKYRDVTKIIEFYFYYKTVFIKTTQNIRDEIVEWGCTHINMQELTAINKKVKELGWEK